MSTTVFSLTPSTHSTQQYIMMFTMVLVCVKVCYFNILKLAPFPHHTIETCLYVEEGVHLRNRSYVTTIWSQKMCLYLEHGSWATAKKKMLFTTFQESAFWTHAMPFQNLRGYRASQPIYYCRRLLLVWRCSWIEIESLGSNYEAFALWHDTKISIYTGLSLCILDVI